MKTTGQGETVRRADAALPDADAMLSDAELSDLLAERPSAATLARLNAVPDGAAELLAVREALADYGSVTLEWAEHHSAAMPSLAAAARRRAGWAAAPAWALALIAIVTVGAGVLHLRGVDGTAAGNTLNAAAAPADAIAVAAPASTLADDNQLMSSIDAALRYNSAAPSYEARPAPANDAVANHAARPN